MFLDGGVSTVCIVCIYGDRSVFLDGGVSTVCIGCIYGVLTPLWMDLCF